MLEGFSVSIFRIYRRYIETYLTEIPCEVKSYKRIVGAKSIQMLKLQT